ncbi:uncharacterized protein LOC114873742 isoform X2 [Osmia bicornis bicornis]|uniref:uncharacterized protein LOC114873742 isoform X2 n=1 Tax=Osmia bicornis bicornis TaxID=1437191 RepID=UPI0010F5DB3D|nr:uncharacterized protein LOC114873742 isoform X2 [Osmia bicornis bicornis]
MNIISGVSSSDLDNESLKRSSWMKIIEKTSAMSKMLQLLTGQHFRESTIIHVEQESSLSEEKEIPRCGERIGEFI